MEEDRKGLSDRLIVLGWQILLVTSALSVLLGILAAVFGGAFTELGRGVGGGNGFPTLIFLIPALFGLILLVQNIFKKKKDWSLLLLVFLGPLIISFGYIIIAHEFDPCFNDLWNINSQIGDGIRLCERFGNEINIHTRFHYLWHITPTIPLIWLYGVLLKKKAPELFVNPKT